MNLAKFFQILDVVDPGRNVPSGNASNVVLFVVFGALLAGAVVGIAFILKNQGKKQK